MQQANSALEKILTDITPDTTLITPNRRLASHLHKRYQNLQRELQNEFWLTPDILPVFNWQERLWNDFTSSEFKDTPLLLNSIQEQFLWEKIIAHSKESEQFLQISETADLARSAFSLLKQWQVNINQSIFASSEDYVAFKQWAHDFTKCCREKNRIDSSSLPDLLITHIKNKTIKPPKHLFLIGFNELAPQFKSLLLACEEQGCIVLKSDPQRQAFCEEESRVIRRKAIDDENELLLMANFAKSIWEKNSVSRPGKPESNDHISMACVIPALEQKRDRVLQIFTQVFSADGQLTLDREKCPFNISAGQSLAHYPIIRTALLLLQLQKKNNAT